MKKCLFSVSYGGFWGQQALSLEQFIVRAKELGYQGIEIMCKRPHLYPFEVTDNEIKKIKDLLQENKIEVACMAAYTNFTAGGNSKEVPFVDLQVSYIKKIARIAQLLDCSLIRIFTGYHNPFEPYEVQRGTCVKAIKQCCDAAKDFGVTIGIQNHHDIAVDTRSLLELFYEIDKPNLGLMVDAWSIVLRNENIEEALDLVKGRVVFTTVADYVILPRYKFRPNLVNYERQEPPLVRAVPMGKGVLDYKRYFSALQSNGYDGWVSYEMCSPLRGGGSSRNLDKCADRFIKFMKENKFC